LCCSIRQDIVQTLRELYTSWLTGEVPNFRRVIIETTGLAEPAPLVASVGCHPLLAEVFALQSIVTLVDAEHGLARQASSVTNRNQICLADRLLISKCDLVEVRAIEALERRLATLNPLAPICRGDRGVNPDFLFTGTAAAMAMSNLRCDRVFDHLAGISSLLLRPEQPLAWPAFQIWLHDLLNQYGSRIMRIKGQLAFEGCPAPLIIQAVHHTFYPIVEAQVAEDGAASDNFLVVVFEGDMPQELEDAMSWLSAAAAG